MSDWELLQTYAKNRSEAAFAELVRRHLNWVYSTALRQTHDPHLAEDVAQAVFVLLARKAGNLRPGTILSGWLFRTTRFVASRAVRTEYRRKAREQTAIAMSTTTSSDENENLWSQLTPHLDQAVAALSGTDRAAILLRFYEKKPLHEVGQQLGLSDEAAKKRVTRAVEKMRSFLTSRGVVLGGAGLIAILAEQTVHAAPTNLAIGVVKAAVTGFSASATLPQLARETLHAWRLAKLKLIAGIAAFSVAGLVLAINLASRHEPPPPPAPSSDKSMAASPHATAVAAPPAQPTNILSATSRSVSNLVIDVFVMEAKTKQPLAGVRVDATDHRKGNTKGQTDENGRYQVHLPDKDTAYVAVWTHPHGFVPLRIHWYTHNGADPIPHEFTFALETATSIGGIVQDEQGQPIAGASVIPEFNRWPNENKMLVDSSAFKEMVTDAQGRWRLDQAPANLQTMELRLKHPDYTDGAYYPGSPDGDNPVEDKLRDMSATYVMKKGLTVAGTVLDQQGRGIQGASVGLGASMYDIKYLKTTTDATGAFHLNNAPSGEGLLTVQADGYAPELKQIDVGGNTSPLEFHLGPGHIIRGQVIDALAYPVAGVQVGIGWWRGHQLLAWHGTTDTNGLYEWTNAPADDVQLGFFKEGYQRLDRYELHPDAENVVVTLKSPFFASGSVTDAQTGELIPTFRITVGQLFEGQPDPSWDPQNHRSFSAGKYEYPVEAVGRYMLRVEAEGYAPEISPEFDSKDEGLLHDFKLTRAPSVQGVVYSPDHRPLEGADVYLVVPRQSAVVSGGHMLPQNQNVTVRTGDDGHFTFSPPGKPYLVVALHEQGCAQATPLADGTLPDMTIVPWARVEGDVFVGAQAAAGRKVNLMRDGHPIDNSANEKPWVTFQTDATTDSSGHFTMEHVPADNVVIGLWISRNDNRHAFSVTQLVHLQTEPGQTAYVKMGGTGQPVIGRLIVPAGFENQMDWVALYPNMYTVMPPSKYPAQLSTMAPEERNQWLQKEMHSYPMIITADGSFRVDDVPSGTYEIQIDIGRLTTNRVFNPRNVLQRQFTIPELPTSRSDEPLDLGDFELQQIDWQKYIPQDSGPNR